MRGSCRKQSRAILAPLKAIGESRHQAKRAAREDGAKTPHEIGRRMRIHSYRTYSAYRSQIEQFLRYVREEHGVKDAFKVMPEHATDWLQSKIASGVKLRTLRTYISALEKFDVGRRHYLHEMKPKQREKLENFRRGWSAGLDEMRALGKEQLDTYVEPRAYNDVSAVISNLDGDFRLVARLQAEAGARLREVTRLTGKNIPEPGVLRLTHTKGGRIREVPIPEDLWTELDRRLAVSPVDVHPKAYTRALENAVASAGERWHGSHGLRYTFARNKVEELTAAGVDYDRTLAKVSQLLGHSRASITEYYLR